MRASDKFIELVTGALKAVMGIACFMSCVTLFNRSTCQHRLAIKINHRACYIIEMIRKMIALFASVAPLRRKDVMQDES